MNGQVYFLRIALFKDTAMHFSLVVMSAPGASADPVFEDVTVPLRHAFSRLGFMSEIRDNSVNPASRNIIFGSCRAPRRIGRSLPPGSVIFNLEQFTAGSVWVNDDYLAHLRDFTVWDYSGRNVRFLEERGVRVRHVPLGYVPEMTRLDPAVPRDIDVLFYGLVNERRDKVLKALLRKGIRVLVPERAFGRERDALIARAKLVLNIHHYVPASLELARLGYVFANSRAVVSEWRKDTECPDYLREACAFFSYEKLVEGVEAMLADGARRQKQAESGFAAFASRPLEETLEKLVGRRPAR